MTGLVLESQSVHNTHVWQKDWQLTIDDCRDELGICPFSNSHCICIHQLFIEQCSTCLIKFKIDPVGIFITPRIITRHKFLRQCGKADDESERLLQWTWNEPFHLLMLGRNALLFAARCSSEQHVLCPIHRSSHSQISLNFLVTTSTAFIQLTVTDSQGKASFGLLWTELPITTAGPCIQLSSSLLYLPRDQITEMLSHVFSVFSEGEYFIPDPQFIRPSRVEGRGLAAVLTHHHSCKRLLILHA